MFLRQTASNVCSGLLRSARMSTTATGKLSGKVAIVTASTEGIGFAIARRLGQDGAKVMVSSRKQDKVEKAVEQLKSEGLDVTGMVCHVGKDQHRKDLIEQTVKQHGSLDILVSNAAVNPFFGNTLEILDINIKAAALLIKEAVTHLQAKGNGSVVIVSSIAAYHGMQMLGPYSVSKTALLALTKILAQECAPKGIRVNGLAPGVIKTNFSGAIWKNESALETILSNIPLRRLGEPSDCAGTVSFLCSDDASYITGETLLVTGGMHSHL